MTDILPQQIGNPQDFVEHPLNANKHPTEQIEELAGAREIYGMYKNLVVWSTPEPITTDYKDQTITLEPDVLYVIAGNGFHQASLLRGDTEVSYTDATGISLEKAIGLMENDNASPLGSVQDVELMLANIKRSENVRASNEGLKRMMTRVKELQGVELGSGGSGKELDTSPKELQTEWAIIIEFESENDQLTAIEKIEGLGYQCQALVS